MRQIANLELTTHGRNYSDCEEQAREIGKAYFGERDFDLLPGVGGVEEYDSGNAIVQPTVVFETAFTLRAR